MTEAEIIEGARRILGNREEASVGEWAVPDEGVTEALRENVEDLNKAFGTSAGRKEITFTAAGGVQDYVVATHVGTDVASIDDVIRSGAFVADGSLGGYGEERDAAGRRVHGGYVPVGFQPEAMQSIEGIHRWLQQDRYHWEIAYPGGVKTLRLMPVPSGEEVVSVRYTTTTSGIETLPDTARSALIYAACVAMLDAQINRTNGERTHVRGAEDATLDRVKILERQRERYEAKYRAAFAKISGA